MIQITPRHSRSSPLFASTKVSCFICAIALSAASLISGCKSDDSDKVGTYCCTVQKFCDNCSTCDRDESDIGDNGNEDACELIVENWLDRGRYCHAVSSYQTGDVATPRYLKSCSN